MKTMKAFAFCAALMTGLAAVPAMPVTTVFAEEEEIPTSGKCGENCTWNWDEETKTLTISGTGEMDEYVPAGWVSMGSPPAAPWDYDILMKIENFVVEEGVTSVTGIGGAENLTNVSLPSTLKIIGNKSYANFGNYVFANCYALKKLVIPEGVTHFYAQLFATPVEEIVIPESLEYIARDAFAGTPWLEAQLKENPFAIVNGILVGTSVLSNESENPVTELVIPDGVTCIACSFGNEELISVTLPDGLKDIGDYTFSGCTSLTEITLPDGAERIGAYAFSGCTSLTEINIPESVTEIGESAFYNTPWLEAKRQENPLVIVNNILLDGTTCEGDIVIPEGITVIADQAFSWNTKLTSITIPEGVTDIPYWTFGECAGLKEVHLPDSLKTIGGAAFEMWRTASAENEEDKSQLETITIPAGVELIDDYAFNMCTNLKGITILNPECKIGETLAICNTNNWQEEAGDYVPEYSGVIRGYDGSTAEAYAKKWGFAFESLGAAPVKEAETGDLDGDSEIGVTDAQLALSAYVKGMTGSDDGLTDAQRKAADIDGDGELTITDAQLILNYYVQNTILGANVTWDELLTK